MRSEEQRHLAGIRSRGSEDPATEDLRLGVAPPRSVHARSRSLGWCLTVATVVIALLAGLFLLVQLTRTDRTVAGRSNSSTTPLGCTVGMQVPASFVEQCSERALAQRLCRLSITAFPQTTTGPGMRLEEWLGSDGQVTVQHPTSLASTRFLCVNQTTRAVHDVSFSPADWQQLLAAGPMTRSLQIALSS